MSFKNFFALLFIISLGTFLVFKFYPQEPKEVPIEEPIVQPKKGSQVHEKIQMPSLSIETSVSEKYDDFILVASLISSILSFFGFLISNYYSLQGHRREEEIFSLKREKERLEMDRLQAEILALRGER